MAEALMILRIVIEKTKRDTKEPIAERIPKPVHSLLVVHSN